MLNSRIPLAFVAALSLAVGLSAAASEGTKPQGVTRNAAKDRGVQVVQLAVTNEGFVPSHVTVKAGKPFSWS